MEWTPPFSNGIEVTPLEVMLEAVREAYGTGGALAAASLANKVAPYVHPKLVALRGKTENDPITKLIEKIPARELALLEALLREAISAESIDARTELRVVACSDGASN